MTGYFGFVGKIILAGGLLFACTTASAQVQTAHEGSVVSQVSVRDSNNEPVPLPYFGEKHLLIFYPDPDKASQNQEFTDYLEEHNIKSDNIYSFGVANLADAPIFPNSLMRSIIRKKERKTGATIYTDPSHILRDAWGLGNVNNLFTIIFVTKDGHIAYLRKGELSEQDKADFFAVIEKYR